MKIGYIMQADSVDMSRVSGPQLHVKAIRNELVKKGHQVRLLAIQNGSTIWTDDLTKWHEAEFGISNSQAFRAFESGMRGAQSRVGFPFFRFFDSYRFSDAVTSAMSGFDILYERFGLMSYGGLIAAKRLNIPIILEVNGDLFAEYEQLGIKLSASQWRVINFISRRMFQSANHIVAVTDALKTDIIHRWACEPRNVSAVTNGADLDLFMSVSGSRKKMMADTYGLTEKSTITFVGGFQPWHSLDLLIKAFSAIAPSNANTRLVLIGDGPERAEIESLVHLLGISDRVVFTGNIPHEQVAALLAISQISVVSSRSSKVALSQSPLKLLEYMAAGNAIVAPDLPSINRLVKHRVTGLLVPPDDQDALAVALDKLLSDKKLQNALGRNAQRQAVEKHSWTRAASEIEAIMFELVSG